MSQIIIISAFQCDLKPFLFDLNSLTKTFSYQGTVLYSIVSGSFFCSWVPIYVVHNVLMIPRNSSILINKDRHTRAITNQI